MHADDPLAPGRVLQLVTGVRPFPVHHRGNVTGRRVEQDVLRPIIAMHQNRRVAARSHDGYRAEADRVDAAQHPAAGIQDRPSHTAVDQLLAVNAGQETERQAGVLAIEDWWHGQPPGQGRQHGRLAHTRCAASGPR
jgi:hypothetical protein